MFQNFFKLITSVFLLVIFVQNGYAQSEQQIIDQYLKGDLKITTQYQKDVVSRYIDRNTVRDDKTVQTYIDPLSFSPEATYLSEDFIGDTLTAPPAGWQNVVNAGGNPAQPWAFGLNVAPYTTPVITGGGFDADFAYLNSDAYGSGNTQNASLITPSINLSAASNVVLSFSEQFRSLTGSSGTLAVSTYGGTTWTNLLVRTTSIGYPNPAVVTTLAVPQAANQANVQFKWTYVGTWAYWWAIDNVVVRDAITPAPPISFNTTNVSASGMTVNWTDNSTDESNFKVYRSTDNITFTQVGSNIPSTTVAGTGTVYSQDQSGLVQNTLYYFRISAVTEGESSYLTGSQTTLTAGNITSAATGNWSDGATWVGGVAPTANDNVTIANGHTVTINSSACYSLLIQNGGILQFEQTTARTLTVATNVTIDNGGVFQSNLLGTVTTHMLSVGGNLTNNGTFDFSTNTNTAGAGITFTGESNNTFGGTGALTDIRTMTINKGTSRNNILEMSPSNFTVQETTTDGTPMAFLTITNGTLKVSGSFTLTGRLFTLAGYTIPANGGFWMNNPNFTVAGQNGSPTVSGLLRMTAGTLNIGTNAGNSMGFATGSAITVEGGAINATGRFGVTDVQM